MATQSGRFGGQYRLVITETGTDGNRYTLRVTCPESTGLSGEHTLWTGEYEQATKLMDFCQQHDARVFDAVRGLYFEGDPTQLLQLVEEAKTSPVARARRRVAVALEVTTDILEGEDAIETTTQRLTAAARMCSLPVNSILGRFVGQVEPKQEPVGLEYCVLQIENAVKTLGNEHGVNGENAMQMLKRALFPQPEEASDGPQ